MKVEQTFIDFALSVEALFPFSQRERRRSGPLP
jgi:hypothetical protein